MVQAASDRIYGKLVAQLAKDFARAGVRLEIPDGIAPDELVQNLHEKLYWLIMERFDEYLTLLYVIDVPETAFRNIQVTDTVDVSAQVVFLILKREMLKVYTQERYSS